MIAPQFQFWEQSISSDDGGAIGLGQDRRDRDPRTTAFGIFIPKIPRKQPRTKSFECSKHRVFVRIIVFSASNHGDPRLVRHRCFLAGSLGQLTRNDDDDD